MANYSGIDPGKFSPYAAKSRKYQRIGDLFRTFGDLRKEKFLRDRQAASDERALAKHNYEMDVYRARLAEYARKTDEHNRLQAEQAAWDALPEQEKAAIQLTSEGWAPKTRTYSGRSGHGQLSPQGDILTSRTTQQFIPPGQQTYQQALASSVARQRMAAQRRNKDLKNAYLMSQTRAMDWLSKKRADDISGAIAGDTVDQYDIPMSPSARIKDLSELIRENVEKNRYNEFADPETGENAGITKSEFQQIRANVWKAAKMLVEKNPQLEWNQAIDIIINAPSGIAKPYSTNAVDGNVITDYVPRTAEDMISLLYNKYVKQPVDEFGAGGATNVSQQQSQPQSQQRPVRITSQAELDALPSGTYFKDDSGETKLKP